MPTPQVRDTMPHFPIIDGISFAYVPEWSGYAVSSDGMVWSCKTTHHGYFSHWKIKRQCMDAFGYSHVGLTDRPRQRQMRVHELMLRSFVGPPMAGQECRHLDGNPRNNSIQNLRWGTRSENRQDAIKHNTFIGLHQRGECHPSAKLSDADVALIRTLRGEWIQNDLASHFGVSVCQISRIQNNRSRI